MKRKGVLSIGAVVGMILVALVFGSLITVTADNTIGIPDAGNASLSNITGATWTLTQLVPLFLAIAVVLSFVIGRKR